MKTTMQGELALEPQMNVMAMAEIVQELVDGGIACLHDGRWLRERARAAGLGQHERAALEALRVRLHTHGTAMLNAAITSVVAW